VAQNSPKQHQDDNSISERRIEFSSNLEDLASLIRKSLFGIGIAVAGLLIIPSETKAENIELEYLKTLEPKAENFAPDAKHYPKIKVKQLVSESTETGMVTKEVEAEVEPVKEDQMPYLWSCADVTKLEIDKQSSSLVFEVSKWVFNSIDADLKVNKDRLRKLAMLGKMLEAYKAKGDPIPQLQERVEKMQDIYQSNLDATNTLIKIWEPVNKEAKELIAMIKQLVAEESRAGKAAEKCAKPQNIDTSLVSKTPPQATNYEDYGPILPSGIAINPFSCGTFDENNLLISSSDIILNLSLLERIITEQILVAMERERAYIENTDRAEGEVGVRNAPERSALLSVIAVRQTNQKILEGWKGLLVKFQSFRQSVISAVQSETDIATELKRCERP
jgi:hypothetical protein